MVTQIGLCEEKGILKIIKTDNLPSIILIILIISQFFPGIDLTHHLATTRLYHEMLTEGRFLLKNPNLLAGQQSTITYGIPFYILGGLVWSIFERFTIDFLMGVTTLFSFLVVRKICDNIIYQATSLVLLWGFIIPDSHIAYCANFFLWLTAYLYLKKSKFYQIPLAIACLTHPFSLVVGFYYAYRERKNVLLIGSFLVYHFIISFMFAAQGSIVLPNIINTLIARVLIGIYPVLLHENIRKKIISTVSISLVALISLSNVVLFLLVEPMQLVGFYKEYRELITDLPRLSGSIRVVDYDYLPSAYFLNQKGLTVTTGSFFESWIPQTRKKWKGIEEYRQHAQDSNLNYVLICKRCGTIFPGAHPSETSILSTFYTKVWENEYYILYSISQNA